MLKTELNEIMIEAGTFLSEEQCRKLKRILESKLENNELIRNETEINFLEMFISAKRIE